MATSTPDSCEATKDSNKDPRRSQLLDDLARVGFNSLHDDYVSKFQLGGFEHAVFRSIAYAMVQALERRGWRPPHA